MTNGTQGMLVKLEAKTHRVKGLTFHPSQTLMLAALHNGAIQLWDYQLGVVLDKFEEHDGPVRGVSFHHSQPLFVSGGDDYKVKVWNLKQKRCLFTLLGHLDYIRTVQFHNILPWICTASDDHTARIWNWQSRQCVAVLTGHNHYVMSARFHPTSDLLVTSSLDQTIRVWDLAGLKEGNKAQFNRKPNDRSASALIQQAAAGADVFGLNDAVTKHILEGHDRGVNWADFHPTQPMIVSGSDDKTVKIWRYSETKAWEVDSLRGHYNNVSCVEFQGDLIISNSEDRSIRVWDANKRVCLQTFRRENDRFWIVATNPSNSLIAAGHDSGFLVFKLDRERPFTVLNQQQQGNALLYGISMSDRTIKSVQLTDQASGAPPPQGTAAGAAQSTAQGQVVTLGTLSKHAPNAMVSGVKKFLVNSFNNTEFNALVVYDDIYEAIDLFSCMTRIIGQNPETKRLTFSGVSAAFVARNRIAVLSKDRLQIAILSLQGEVVKTVDLANMVGTTDSAGSVSSLLEAGVNRVLVVYESRVRLLDLGTRNFIGEIQLNGVRQAIWNSRFDTVGLLTKHSVTLCKGQNLEICSTVIEKARIKSGAWDESHGIFQSFLYTTQSHLKYLLTFGESGLLKSLPNVTYLSGVLKNGSIIGVTRDVSKTLTGGQDGVVRLGNAVSFEYLFKTALHYRQYEEVKQAIKNGRLCGNVVIGYLKSKGFPEVALQFVDDMSTRFSLALEFAHIEEALKAAKEIDDPDTWKRLAKAAIDQGNVSIAELGYQKAKDFNALVFLYVITGNFSKLSKLQKIAEARGDLQARWNVAALVGSEEEKFAVLQDGGLKGLSDKLKQMKAKPLSRPEPVVSVEVSGSNWELSTSIDLLFANQWKGVEAVQPAVSAADQYIDAEETKTPQEEEVVADSGAWGADEELFGSLPQVSTSAPSSSNQLSAGAPVEQVWLSKRKLPADLVLAGEFKDALTQLQKRIDLVNPKPLQNLFMEIYASNRVTLPGLPLTNPIVLPVLIPGSSLSDPTPVSPYTADSLSNKLKEGLRLTTQGKFVEALTEFRSILVCALMAVADSQEQETLIKEIISTASTYALAMLIEVTRRSEPENSVRNLELACFMATACKLQPTHALLALRLAMTANFKAGNFIVAAGFAKRLVTENFGQPREAIDQFRRLLGACEEKAADAVALNFDPATDVQGVQVCAGSLKKLKPTENIVKCPYCSNAFSEKSSGSVCSVCQLSRVGGKCIGMQWKAL